MKRFFLLALLLAVSTVWSQTETPASTPAPAPAAAPDAPGTTTVTSDQFKLDMPNKQGLFTGNVVVIGANFKMRSREMTVYFNETNQVKKLVARGNVEIEQPDRTGKAGQLEYTTSDAKMVLTESPQVTQNRNTVTGNIITIFKDSNRMDVDGRSRVILYQSESSANKPAVKK
jgi:lipopolysaccharide export system protein LptA